MRSAQSRSQALLFPAHQTRGCLRRGVRSPRGVFQLRETLRAPGLDQSCASHGAKRVQSLAPRKGMSDKRGRTARGLFSLPILGSLTAWTPDGVQQWTG